MTTKKQKSLKTKSLQGGDSASNVTSPQESHYPLCDIARNLLNEIKPYFKNEVERIEDSLSSFTNEEQKYIVDWAEEVACAPYVSSFFIPENEREEEIKTMVNWIGMLIREYENTKRMEYLYEQKQKIKNYEH